VNPVDQALWNQFAESAIGRLAAAVFAAIAAAHSGSVAAGWANEARQAWDRFAPSRQWQLIAIVLIAAVLTHLGLLALQHPSGWWWWAIPGMAGGFALLILALATMAKRTA
jgi:protein-S-isoprenylcysteine O-methyltransferase Ste14